MGAFNPVFDREVVAQVGAWGVSGGWVSYASIVLRFLLTAGAALVLTATTSFTGVCLALQKLRVPDVARHAAPAALPLHLRARRRGAAHGAGAAPAQLRAPRHGLARLRADARPAAAAHVRARPAHLPGDEVRAASTARSGWRGACTSARPTSSSCSPGRPPSCSSGRRRAARARPPRTGRLMSAEDEPPHDQRPRPELRLPGRHARPRRRVLRGRARRGDRRGRRQRRRQVDPAPAPQRPAHAGARAPSTSAASR